MLQWQTYQERQRQIESTLLHEMKLFSFDPRSNAFEVSFIPYQEDQAKVYTLYKTDREIYAVFEIPDSKKFLMKVSLSKEAYQQRLRSIKTGIYKGILGYGILIALLAFLLAYYTLYPLKKALQLNEEFVKDILHDINTPLSSLLINLKILKKRFGENRGFERMQHNVETIENLQANLKSFLHRQPQSNERFGLHAMVQKRIEYFRVLYPEITYTQEIDPDIEIECSHEAFTRILDNLLSNAGKYNRTKGKVDVTMQEKTLIIEDTGIGIQYPEKVFQRHYKEGERGLGLGLHIVQKLSDMMGIQITLTSHMGQGTRVMLDLSAVMLR